MIFQIMIDDNKYSKFIKMLEVRSMNEFKLYNRNLDTSEVAGEILYEKLCQDSKV